MLNISRISCNIRPKLLPRVGSGKITQLRESKIKSYLKWNYFLRSYHSIMWSNHRWIVHRISRYSLATVFKTNRVTARSNSFIFLLFFLPHFIVPHGLNNVSQLLGHLVHNIMYPHVNQLLDEGCGHDHVQHHFSILRLPCWVNWRGTLWFWALDEPVWSLFLREFPFSGLKRDTCCSYSS